MILMQFNLEESTSWQDTSKTEERGRQEFNDRCFKPPKWKQQFASNADLMTRTKSLKLIYVSHLSASEETLRFYSAA